jgi:hypothetical protein
LRQVISIESYLQKVRERQRLTPVTSLGADRYVAAAALFGPALRGGPELEMTSPWDRSAAAIVADDLA